MNFFAHALPWLDDPWFVAGTCLPDWMSVINRRVRLRSKKVQPRVDDSDSRTARVARGIVQHHADDEWFHETPEFAQLNLQFSVQLREDVKLDDSLRTRFVGHILIEMLLDDWLSKIYPGKLKEYYLQLERLCGRELERIVIDLAGLSPEATGQLPIELPVEKFLPRFRQERFLFDYSDDPRLLYRLNQVMRRVRLPALPPAILDWLPGARRDVLDLAPRLLSSYRWPVGM
ncbi:MAG: hypothetical protein ACKO0N_01070, partial [Planctomycetota bacterium]